MKAEYSHTFSIKGGLPYPSGVMNWLVGRIENRGLKQQLPVSAEKSADRAQGKTQTCTYISFVDYLRISNKNTNTDSYCLNPQMTPVTF